MLFSAAVVEADLEYIYHLQYYGSKTRAPSSFLSIPGPVDESKLPSGLVGYWPLDGNGFSMDGVEGGELDGTDPSARWVAGKYGFALAFGNTDSGTGFVVPENAGRLAAIQATVTMVAWVRPVNYDSCADRGVIMNKESHFEMGIESNLGALQAAGAGCWRWWGTHRVPLFEWTMAAVSFDGSKEKHFIDGIQVQQTECAGDTSSLPEAPLRIGARSNIGADHGSIGDWGSSNLDEWAQFSGDIDEVICLVLCVLSLDNTPGEPNRARR
jgi:hypothetical protein